MEDISSIHDIVMYTLVTSFFSTSSVDIVRFVDPCKVVVERSTFLTLVNWPLKMFKKWRQKSFIMESWSTYFHNLKEILIYKKLGLLPCPPLPPMEAHHFGQNEMWTNVGLVSPLWDISLVLVYRVFQNFDTIYITTSKHFKMWYIYI